MLFSSGGHTAEKVSPQPRDLLLVLVWMWPDPQRFMCWKPGLNVVV